MAGTENQPTTSNQIRLTRDRFEKDIQSFLPPTDYETEAYKGDNNIDWETDTSYDIKIIYEIVGE